MCLKPPCTRYAIFQTHDRLDSGDIPSNLSHANGATAVGGIQPKINVFKRVEIDRSERRSYLQVRPSRDPIVPLLLLPLLLPPLLLLLRFLPRLLPLPLALLRPPPFPPPLPPRPLLLPRAPPLPRPPFAPRRPRATPVSPPRRVRRGHSECTCFSNPANEGAPMYGIIDEVCRSWW